MSICQARRQHQTSPYCCSDFDIKIRAASASSVVGHHRAASAPANPIDPRSFRLVRPITLTLDPLTGRCVLTTLAKRITSQRSAVRLVPAVYRRSLVAVRVDNNGLSCETEYCCSRPSSVSLDLTSSCAHGILVSRHRRHCILRATFTRRFALRGR
jgi:hypothetical protein